MEPSVVPSRPIRIKATRSTLKTRISQSFSFKHLAQIQSMEREALTPPTIGVTLSPKRLASRSTPTLKSRSVTISHFIDLAKDVLKILNRLGRKSASHCQGETSHQSQFMAVLDFSKMSNRRWRMKHQFRACGGQPKSVRSFLKSNKNFKTMLTSCKS